MWSEDSGPRPGLSVFDQTQKERFTRLGLGLCDDNTRGPPAEQAMDTALLQDPKGPMAWFRM